MTTSPLADLARLCLTSEQAERLGVEGDLELRRVWPRGAERLGLQAVDSAGRAVAGQWLADHNQLRDVALATAVGGGPVVTLDNQGVLLQARGADRKLLALRDLVSRPGSTLVVHRPERRAVVRCASQEGVTWAKVVRPERTIPLLARAAMASTIRGFTTPTLGAVVASGLTYWSTLPGRALYDLLGEVGLPAAAGAVGAALRALHDGPLPTSGDDDQTLGRHDAAREGATLDRWLERTSVFAPEVAAHAAERMPIVQRLLHQAPGPSVLVHRDLYDKQVFVDKQGGVGLLDFDTLAVGEAALDLANVLVHLELRVLQGHCSASAAATAANALVEAYAPTDTDCRRLPAYAAASRLRLACVYALRPPWRSVVDPLLDRVEAPLPV